MKLNVSYAAVFAALAALAVAGCGSDNSSSNSSSSSSDTSAAAPPATSGSSGSSGGGASTNLQLAADSSGSLKFDKAKLNAKAGNVTITMDNPSPLSHAVGIKGNGVDKDGNTVSMGGKSTVTVSLKPGTYEFYCPVDGHEAAGMKGTLTVK